MSTLPWFMALIVGAVVALMMYVVRWNDGRERMWRETVYDLESELDLSSVINAGLVEEVNALRAEIAWLRESA